MAANTGVYNSRIVGSAEEARVLSKGGVRHTPRPGSMAVNMLIERLKQNLPTHGEVRKTGSWRFANPAQIRLQAAVAFDENTNPVGIRGYLGNAIHGTPSIEQLTSAPSLGSGPTLGGLSASVPPPHGANADVKTDVIDNRSAGDGNYNTSNGMPQTLTLREINTYDDGLFGQAMPERAWEDMVADTTYVRTPADIHRASVQDVRREIYPARQAALDGTPKRASAFQAGDIRSRGRTQPVPRTSAPRRLRGDYTLRPETKGDLFIGFVGGYTVNSPYGIRNGKLHDGNDLPFSTAVYAGAEGTVTFARYAERGSAYSGYGNTVEIQHPNGYRTFYGHMHATPMVSEGQYIAAGTQLGVAGNTGHSSGIHLHIGCRNPQGQSVDPFYHFLNPDKYTITAGGSNPQVRAEYRKYVREYTAGIE